MIRSHRRAHLLVTSLLGPIAAVILFAALAARSPAPRPTALPAWVGHGTLDAGNPPVARPTSDPIWSRSDLVSPSDALPAIRIDAFPEGLFEMKPLGPLLAPDVLVYYRAADSPSKSVRPTRADEGAVPKSSLLLGRLNGSRIQGFALPSGVVSRAQVGISGGELLFFSLGHQEVVARVALPPLRRDDS